VRGQKDACVTGAEAEIAAAAKLFNNIETHYMEKDDENERYLTNLREQDIKYARGKCPKEKWSVYLRSAEYRNAAAVDFEINKVKNIELAILERLREGEGKSQITEAEVGEIEKDVTDHLMWEHIQSQSQIMDSGDFTGIPFCFKCAFVGPPSHSGCRNPGCRIEPELWKINT